MWEKKLYSRMQLAKLTNHDGLFLLRVFQLSYFIVECPSNFGLVINLLLIVSVQRSLYWKSGDVKLASSFFLTVFNGDVKTSKLLFFRGHTCRSQFGVVHLKLYKVQGCSPYV